MEERWKLMSPAAYWMGFVEVSTNEKNIDVILGVTWGKEHQLGVCWPLPPSSL